MAFSFQAASDLCLFLSTTDGVSEAHYKLSRMEPDCDEFSPSPFIRCCFVSLQLTARLDVLDTSFADNTPPFSPEESASYAQASLTGHIPAISAILSCSDQYLARQPSREEPAERSASYSPFAEMGGRAAAVQEANQCQTESAVSFGDTGNTLKVNTCWFNLTSCEQNVNLNKSFAVRTLSELGYASLRTFVFNLVLTVESLNPRVSQRRKPGFGICSSVFNLPL